MKWAKGKERIEEEKQERKSKQMKNNCAELVLVEEVAEAS